MSNQICLKWNSFLNNIATSFESLWEEEGLVDVTLASDGQCLTAHKVILSASSPFFKKVFQTNPCQHPVIILQDVHFSELEALLIFIYKGEVNIEQKNLPALLKAAETLQIRGLSGGDIFAKESYKRLVELEQAVEEGTATAKEETPKKKQKLNKHQNSILESALTPKVSQVENTDESTTSEQSGKEGDYLLQKNMQNPIYHRLEMKIEPLETVLEDSQKQSATDKDPTERLDTGQLVGSQGSSKPNVTVIADARETSTPSSEPETRARFPIDLDRTPPWNTYRHSDELHLPNHLYSESMPDQQESTSNILVERDARVLHSVFPTCPGTAGNSEFPEETVNGVTAYPPFPCPFCDRAYTSWGFRRRHIKAVHTISPSLNCKWCLQVLPTHAAWRRHVILAHNLSASDAHNGLLILEEAHMVLQIARPTRIECSRRCSGIGRDRRVPLHTHGKAGPVPLSICSNDEMVENDSSKRTLYGFFTRGQVRPVEGFMAHRHKGPLEIRW
ncbi:zinc finger and BTB domain-containing protein 37-like isoform X4 [Bombus pyrosoma]|uniref:zinc finger and BTB domain-containing protein 37-like isoform X4 n=1 Tax=Bombus pyrosoma TaxID=396416 RepID=UPI001CB9CAF2|nr:zinc finger and BTB domain-containing protein 37-like isoform X4 [Bombus pyrosoma]